jgi:hypothetical protein
MLAAKSADWTDVPDSCSEHEVGVFWKPVSAIEVAPAEAVRFLK